MTLTTKLNTADLFDGLQEEEQHDFREFEIERNPTLNEMVNGFEKFLQEALDDYPDHVSYQNAERYLPQSYTAKEIEQFSLLLRQFQDGDEFPLVAGLYLSRLINDAQEEQITIHTTHLTEGISKLGTYNENKCITVKGDVTFGLGRKMKSGKIIVYGNAGGFVGDGMQGGEIYVEGYTTHSAGVHMSDGKIFVKGDAGLISHMLGRELHVGGNLGTFPRSMKGGDIYHKGNLIVKDGKPIWH